MRRIGILLSLALLARAGDPPGPDTVVRRVHDLAGLKDDPVLLAVALGRVRVAAGIAEILVQGGAIELHAPVCTQLRVERALREVREECGKIIRIEVHFVTLKGDPGTKEVPASDLDAFLKERRAERIASHTFSCQNFRKAGVELAREVSYVSGFDIEVGGGSTTVTNPQIDAVREIWTARFEPAAVGTDLRITAELSVTEVAIEEFISSLAPGLNASVPKTKARTTRQHLTCPADVFAVVDLQDSVFVLVRATVADAPKGR